MNFAETRTLLYRTPLRSIPYKTVLSQSIRDRFYNEFDKKHNQTFIQIDENYRNPFN